MTIKKFFGSSGVGKVLGGVVGAATGGAVDLNGLFGSGSGPKQNTAVAATSAPAKAAAPAASRLNFEVLSSTRKWLLYLGLGIAATIAIGPSLAGAVFKPRR